MGTLSYYIIIGILKLFNREEEFLKKSLESKLIWFASLHDALTSIWLIVSIITFGVGFYGVCIVLLSTYIVLTIYEYFKGTIFFFRESHKMKYYTKYMAVDWDEVERIIKLRGDETHTEN